MASRSCAHGSAGTSATPTIDGSSTSNRSRQAGRRPRRRWRAASRRSSRRSSPRSRIVSIIPGIDTGAPERTLTSSGSAGSPKRRPSAASRPRHPLAQLVVEAGRPAVGEVGAAGLGRDDEAGRHGQPEIAGHDAEVRRLAAEQRPRSASDEVERLVERVRVGHGRSASPRLAERAPDALRRSAAGRGSRPRSRRGPRRRPPGATCSSAPSLMPFEPYGPGPSSFSTTALSIDRQVHAGRDPVVDRAEVADAALRRRAAAAPSACGPGP